MKKFAAFLLALLCVATLASCNNDNPENPDESKDPGYAIDSGEPTDSGEATDDPATEAPATDAPATEAPVTEAPATEAPVTEAPATEAPRVDPADIVFTPVENKVVYVSAANVNIRKTPEVVDGNVVTSVKYGDSFVCLATSENWYKITYADQECYISAHYVTFDNLTKDDFEATNDYVEIIVDVANVRTGPSTDTEAKGFLNKGAIVTRLAKNENWSKISYDGGVAYVHNSCIGAAPETTVAS